MLIVHILFDNAREAFYAQFEVRVRLVISIATGKKDMKKFLLIQLFDIGQAQVTLRKLLQHYFHS